MGPLEGIRILDLSRVLAGPFCTMILGDLGAEVIKIEMPDMGDETRSWGPPFINGESAYFLSINRNKRSMTLNLREGRGREILYRLAENSDVLVENFRPGVVSKLKIDYEIMKGINPKIIYCSISGFGQTGPYRDRPAYDIIIQGMGGFMGITGELNRPPVRIGVAITDMIAGLYAALAIVSSIMAREKTGRGQYIDVSLLDSAASFMTYMAMNYFATGRIPERMGSAHPNIVPYQCFKAKDGKYIIIAVTNDAFWREFCKVLGVEHLTDDPKFATNPKRVENRDELIAMLSDIIVRWEVNELLRALINAGIPCGPVYTMDEVFSDPQVLHREMLVEVSHPTIGRLKQIGISMKFSETGAEVRRPPPLLGQHTDEILKELGYTDGEIERLRAEGVV